MPEIWNRQTGRKVFLQVWRTYPYEDMLTELPGVEFRETEYDYARAAEEIRRSGVPLANDFAEHVLHPPTQGP